MLPRNKNLRKQSKLQGNNVKNNLNFFFCRKLSEIHVHHLFSATMSLLMPCITWWATGNAVSHDLMDFLILSFGWLVSLDAFDQPRKPHLRYPKWIHGRYNIKCCLFIESAPWGSIVWHLVILSTQWVDILFLIRVSKRLIASVVTLLFPFESPEKAFFMVTTKNTVRWLFYWGFLVHWKVYIVKHVQGSLSVDILLLHIHASLVYVVGLACLLKVETYGSMSILMRSLLAPQSPFTAYTCHVIIFFVNEKAGIENNVLWSQCAGWLSCCIMLPYIFNGACYIKNCQ